MLIVDGYGKYWYLPQHTRYHTQYALYSIQVVAGAIAQAFGPVYFSVNFGLMFTSALVLYGSLIIVTQVGIARYYLQ